MKFHFSLVTGEQSWIDLDNENATIADVKNTLCALTGITQNQIRIIMMGQIVQDEVTVRALIAKRERPHLVGISEARLQLRAFVIELESQRLAKELECQKQSDLEYIAQRREGELARQRLIPNNASFNSATTQPARYSLFSGVGSTTAQSDGYYHELPVAPAEASSQSYVYDDGNDSDVELALAMALSLSVDDSTKTYSP